MKVKIKKLGVIEEGMEGVIPKYSKKGDAGMDLTATSMRMVDESQYGYIEYGTGIALEIPDGYVGLVFPRSSCSDTGLILSNCVGVIDSGYRGEIKCRFKAIPDTVIYQIGERIAQLIIMPFPKIEFVEEELSESERAEGGHGSTGKK